MDTNNGTAYRVSPTPSSGSNLTSPISPVSVTGPPAESGLPPSRPSAAHTAISQTVAITPALTSPRISQAPSTLHSPSVGNDSASRPTTAGSRSHVASLRSPAFLTPMSSQRLQAHRGQWPSPPPIGQTRENSFESEDHFRNPSHRDSSETATTARERSGPGGLHTQYYEDEGTVAPASRASLETERTEQPHDQNLATAPTNSRLVNTDFRHDAAQSVETFNDTNGAQKSASLEPKNEHIADHESASKSRSPREFVAAFRGRGGEEYMKASGHEKLSSLDSSSSKKLPPSVQKSNNVSAAQDDMKFLGRNWEYFDGNTIFFLNGRLQTARDRPIVVATGLAIILPSILFYIFGAPWLWHHVSAALPILYSYLLFVTMSAFFHACFSDPGILPRNLHRFPPEDLSTDPLALGPPTTRWTLVTVPGRPQGAFEVPTKYCKTCKIWRPARCHHCRICDSCIDTQDHHCVWLNNCIGRRNYKYFLGFVAGATVLGAFLFGSTLGLLLEYSSTHHLTFRQTLGDSSANGVSMFLCLYGIIGLMYPLALFGYHMFLIARGESTREYLNSKKFLKRDQHRPFDQGRWWRNFVVTCCRPQMPSFIGFDKAHERGDQRFRLLKETRKSD